MIRRHLNIKEYSENKILKAAFEFSRTRANIESVFNCTVEEMILINMEFPVFNTLKTIVDKAMVKASRYFYKNIYSYITPKQKDIIDQILLINSETYTKQSNWKKIKSEPPAVSTNNLKEYVKHVQWLQSFFDKKVTLDHIPAEKARQFYSEGMSLNLYKVKRSPICKNFEGSKETIPLSKSEPWKELSLDWIPDKARKFVKPKNGYLNRNAYELCLIAKTIDEIRSKDLYVLNSLEYDSHKHNLISTQRFEFVSENYCKLVGIYPSHFKMRIQHH